jgi:hypothetical protein
LIRRHPALGFKLLDDTRQLTDESKIIVLQLMREEMLQHSQRDLFKRFVLLLKPPEGIRT